MYLQGKLYLHEVLIIILILEFFFFFLKSKADYDFVYMEGLVSNFPKLDILYFNIVCDFNIFASME